MIWHNKSEDMKSNFERFNSIVKKFFRVLLIYDVNLIIILIMWHLLSGNRGSILWCFYYSYENITFLAWAASRSSWTFPKKTHGMDNQLFSRSKLPFFQALYCSMLIHFLPNLFDFLVLVVIIKSFYLQLASLMVQTIDNSWKNCVNDVILSLESKNHPQVSVSNLV